MCYRATVFEEDTDGAEKENKLSSNIFLQNPILVVLGFAILYAIKTRQIPTVSFRVGFSLGTVWGLWKLYRRYQRTRRQQSTIRSKSL